MNPIKKTKMQDCFFKALGFLYIGILPALVVGVILKILNAHPGEGVMGLLGVCVYGWFWCHIEKHPKSILAHPINKISERITYWN